MGCILLALVEIFARQYNIATKVLERTKTAHTWKDYVLLQFPFELHLGWIAAASALNLNVLVVALDGNAETQLVAAGLSLAALVAVSLACLFSLKRTQYVIPLVSVWATVS